MRAAVQKVGRVIVYCNFTKPFHVIRSMLLPRPLIEYPALLFAHDLLPLEFEYTCTWFALRILPHLHAFQTSGARKTCCMYPHFYRGRSL